jgi:zinc transport system substrate-binding protein
MNIKKIICRALIFNLILSGIFLYGCSNKELEIEKESKPMIAVTIPPQKTFVEAVCGDLVDVVTLVPPGNSPENYEPTPMEIEKFKKSSIYFSIGVAIEEANIMPNVGDIKVISLNDAVSPIYPDRTFESGERDPHIWLSPKRVKIMVEVIAEEMGKFDEANKDVYLSNAELYINKLEDIDKEIKEILDGVKNKKFIVYHPSFGYIADDYGLEMYAIEEEGKEATAIHLQEVIDYAKKENIKVVFYQEEIDSSQSQAFAEEIGGKTIQLSPLSEDYIGNLKKMAETMSEVMQ